jgi:hypothetical protein
LQGGIDHEVDTVCRHRSRARDLHPFDSDTEHFVAGVGQPNEREGRLVLRRHELHERARQDGGEEWTEIAAGRIMLRAFCGPFEFDTYP